MMLEDPPGFGEVLFTRLGSIQNRQEGRGTDCLWVEHHPGPGNPPSTLRSLPPGGVRRIPSGSLFCKHPGSAERVQGQDSRAVLINLSQLRLSVFPAVTFPLKELAPLEEGTEAQPGDASALQVWKGLGGQGILRHRLRQGPECRRLGGDAIPGSRRAGAGRIRERQRQGAFLWQRLTPRGL